jgi:hypothetical protein
MRTAVDYAARAEECRRLSKICKRPEDWAAFLEMADTWEMLLRHQQETSRSKTIALADRFRNVLFLSDIPPKKRAETEAA